MPICYSFSLRGGTKCRRGNLSVLQSNYYFNRFSRSRWSLRMTDLIITCFELFIKLSSTLTLQMPNLFLIIQLLCPSDKTVSGEVNSLNLSSVRYSLCIKNSFTDKLVPSSSLAISETLL